MTAVEVDRGLAAACDVLVVRALELIGKRIVRIERSRFNRLGTLAFHEAHILWQPDKDTLDKALASAWDYLPDVIRNHAIAGTDADEVRLALERYIHDLVQMKRGHSVEELRYRLSVFT
jgi:hypothetical protein